MSGNVSRPRVVAQPSGPAQRPSAPSQAPGLPLQMGAGRVPEGGQGINNMAKIKSIFDGNTGNLNPNLSHVRMAGGGQKPKQTRPVVIARVSMGQETQAVPASVMPPAQPPTNIQEVLLREGGPQGLTRKEAADIAAALEAGIASSVAALEDGQTCVGVDDSAIESARDILGGVQRFSVVGNSSERLELRPSELDLIEKILECGWTYEKLQAAGKGKTIAFVAGGLIIGAVVLLATT